jgi:hypothetical protein
MKWLGLPLTAMAFLLIGRAEASQLGQTAVGYWKAADKCAKQAQAAYPDYSEEANAKRDTALKNCLNGSNLAPRQPLSQPPPR